MSDQNIRDETGALIGGLDCLDYTKGFEDFIYGRPPPEISSVSYDLGRQRAAEDASAKREIFDWIRRDSDQRMARLKKMLTPEAFAELKTKIDEIWKRSPKEF